MLTWAKIGLALLSLLRTLAAYGEQLRVRKEVLNEQRDKQDEIIDEKKAIDTKFDKLTPADRERLRNSEGLYRD